MIFAPEVLVYAIILTIYFYFTFGFSFDNCEAGYQGPGTSTKFFNYDKSSLLGLGGLDMGARYFNCTGGAAGYLDRLLFGDKHIYQNPTSMLIYGHNLPYDPEGLLGSTTSVLLTAVGLISGRVLIKQKNPYRRAIRWFLIAATTGK